MLVKVPVNNIITKKKNNMFLLTSFIFLNRTNKNANLKIIHIVSVKTGTICMLNKLNHIKLLLKKFVNSALINHPNGSGTHNIVLFFYILITIFKKFWFFIIDQLFVLCYYAISNNICCSFCK